MALPDDHQIRRFAGAELELIENYIGPDRELIVDTTNHRLILHDGVTPGGHTFYNTEDIVAILNGPTQLQGDDDLAYEGLDTEQRTWPATTFGQYAALVGPNDFSNDLLVPTPANADSSRRAASTEWVKANFMPYPSQSLDPNITDFPIGQTLLITGAMAGAQRNQITSDTVRIHDGSNRQWKLGGSGAALAGQWRWKGISDETHGLVQRVS